MQFQIDDIFNLINDNKITKEHFEIYLNNGGDINYEDQYFDNFLIKSIKCDIEIIKYLIDKGIDINHQNGFNETALIEAVYCNRIELVELLLNKGANPLLQAVNDDALLIACKFNHIDIIKLLLKYNSSNINNKNGHGDTPIYLACRNSSIEAVKILLDYGAKPNIYDLSISVQLNNLEIIKLLVNYMNINSRYENNDTILTYTCNLNTYNIETIELLLKLGANINLQDRYGDTALSIASFNDKLDLVNFLLKYDANPNIRNNYENNPIMMTDNNEIFQILIKKTKNIKKRNTSGNDLMIITLNHSNNNNNINFILKHKNYHTKMMKLKKINLNQKKLYSKKILLNL